MKFYKLGLGCVLVASAMSQTRVDLRTQTKNVDFSGANSTKPSQTGTVLPAACSVGQTFFKTDAPAGQNLYACTAVNVWTVEGGGGLISVFGRTGAVTAQSGDYSAAQISGLAPSATTDTTNATNITSGTLGAARLPTPGAATLGGVQSKDCTSGGQFLQKINVDGSETCGTPAGGGNVSGPGAVTSGYVPLWGASNNLLTVGLALSATPGANTVVEADSGGHIAAGWVPTLNQATTANAGTATQLAATPTLCSTGNAPTGILANGNATGCAAIGGGGGVADPGANGFMVRTALNTTQAVTITGGTGITVTNGNGVSGGPLITLDTTVGTTQAQVQTLSPLVLSATVTGNVYGGTMNPPPGGFVDINGNPLIVDFCPATTWTGGAVSVNPGGIGAKRILINGYDPPANALLASSCYLLAYNPTMSVDGVASVGAFELKSLPGVSPYSFLPNAGTAGTTLYKLTKLTGAPSTAVSAATSDTGGVVGITVAGAGTTLTAVMQTTGYTSCVFDGATTAGHYVQISSTAAGDCHDSGASYPTSGQVIGRVLATNASAGTYAIQLFGAEVQAAAPGPGSGTVTSVATTAPISGGPFSTSGTISCPTCMTTGTALVAAQEPAHTGDVTNPAGSLATTIAANAVTSAKMAVVNTRRTCSVLIGADNGTALANADMGPQGRQCFVPAAATVVEITIAADGGVPSVLVRKNHGGVTTNLTSAAFATAASGGLACANAAGSGPGIDGATTCATALTATALAAGDWLELASGTADGTAKRMSVDVTYTVN